MTPTAFTVNGASAFIKYVPSKKLFSASASGHVGYGKTIAASLAALVRLAASERKRHVNK